MAGRRVSSRASGMCQGPVARGAWSRGRLERPMWLESREEGWPGVSKTGHAKPCGQGKLWTWSYHQPLKAFECDLGTMLCGDRLDTEERGCEGPGREEHPRPDRCLVPWAMLWPRNGEKGLSWCRMGGCVVTWHLHFWLASWDEGPSKHG